MDTPLSLELARDYLGPDRDRRQLSRAASSGAAVRVRRGAYLPADAWAAMSLREKYLARMAAAAATRSSKPVFSHESAAAFWDLPMIHPWPTQVHLTIDPGLGTRSRGDLIRHSAYLEDEDVIDLEHFYVTSIARTVLDLAATSSFAEAVIIADRALLVDRFGRRPPLTTRQELEAARDRGRFARPRSR